MKNIVIISIGAIIAIFVLVKYVIPRPAAEDRFKMHENAKRVSDSIAKEIDEGLAKGAIPGTSTVIAAPDTAKALK